MPSRKPKYENRIVLFLDFLGFSEIVDKTATDPEELHRLVAAIERIKEIGTDNAGLFRSQRLTQFSDCVVVSYRVEEPAAVFWLLNAVALCVIDLAERGYLVRGGITAGKLYHTKKHVVGPAIVRAHEMESKEAIHPRVLIDAELVEVAKVARSEHHEPDEEADYVRGFMTEDKDGRHFFDYFSWNSVVSVVGGQDELYPNYLLGLHHMISAGLAHSNQRVRQKYEWMAAHYNGAFEVFDELPEGHAYQIENPEICEAIANLPRFEDISA